MKKLFLFTAILMLIATINYGQYDTSRLKESNANLKERYMQKSNRLKTTAWVLLTGGVALNALSFAFQPKDSDDFSSGFDKVYVSAALIGIGTAAMITSIPLFFASSKYKRKANLIVNTTRVQLPPGVKTSGLQLGAGLSVRF